MTNTTIHIPVEKSAVTGAIVSLLTSANIIVAGLLSFAQFVAIG